jgi:hypothetical protein
MGKKRHPSFSKSTAGISERLSLLLCVSHIRRIIHTLSAGSKYRYGCGQRLSIPKSTISYWVREDKKGKLSCLGSSRKSLTETEMELAKIKRELAQVKMEHDFLKKAAAYFAKEP